MAHFLMLQYLHYRPDRPATTTALMARWPAIAHQRALSRRAERAYNRDDVRTDEDPIMNRRGVLLIVLAFALAMPALAQQTDYRTGFGLIFTGAPETYTVVGSGSGLIVIDARSGSIWTIAGPLPPAALLGSAGDEAALDDLATVFARSFGAGAALDQAAAQPLDHPDGAALLIPFQTGQLRGLVALLRTDDGRIVIVTGLRGGAASAADLADEAAALLAHLRVGDPVAPPGPDAPLVLGQPPAAVAFTLPDGFRAGPVSADEPLVILDTLPDPAGYLQVTVRLNTDDALTPALWKAQFFVGLAETIGDAAYDPQTSWQPLADQPGDVTIEVYRAPGRGAALSAQAYLITVSPGMFVVITALGPDAAVLEARAAALDALALSVRPVTGE
jgi:hypothetical protein